jgi:hypothetical protein
MAHEAITTALGGEGCDASASAREHASPGATLGMGPHPEEDRACLDHARSQRRLRMRRATMTSPSNAKPESLLVWASAIRQEQPAPVACIVVLSLVAPPVAVAARVPPVATILPPVPGGTVLVDAPPVVGNPPTPIAPPVVALPAVATTLPPAPTTPPEAVVPVLPPVAAAPPLPRFPVLPPILGAPPTMSPPPPGAPPSAGVPPAPLLPPDPVAPPLPDPVVPPVRDPVVPPPPVPQFFDRSLQLSRLGWRLLKMGHCDRAFLLFAWE